MSDTLEAGHALDLLIHSRVFGARLLTQDEMQAEAEKVWADQPSCRVFLTGFTAIDHTVIGGPFTFRQNCPRYSAEVGTAWTVAENLRDRGWGVVLTSIPRNGIQCEVLDGTNEGRFVATSMSAPLSLCLAAFDAVSRHASLAEPRP